MASPAPTDPMTSPPAFGGPSGGESVIPQVFPPQNYPPEMSVPQDMAAPLIPGRMTEGFVYNPEGRRDPFFPFRGVPGKVAPVPVEKAVDPLSYDPKDPLQAYQLQEYKLVAVMWDVREPRAMVATPDGKVWTIRQKYRLGKEGAVVAVIREGEIVVAQPNPDGTFGSDSARVISMKK